MQSDFKCAHRKRKQDVRDDMKRGGRLAFRVLQDDRPIMPNAFQVTKRFKLLPQRRHLNGSCWQRVSHVRGIDPEKPLHYCGETSRILGVGGSAIKLDRPLIANADCTHTTQFLDIIGDDSLGCVLENR